MLQSKPNEYSEELARILIQFCPNPATPEAMLNIHEASDMGIAYATHWPKKAAMGNINFYPSLLQTFGNRGVLHRYLLQ